MNYLRNRKSNRGFPKTTVIVIVVIAIIVYFRAPIFGGLSSVAQFIARPILKLGGAAGDGLENAGSPFYSKRALILENEKLRSKLSEQEARMSNYNSILTENVSLKESLARSPLNNKLVLSAILSKPHNSPYDTMLIDAGTRHGLKEGNLVFAKGDVPIGRVEETFPSSSKVVLFSSPGIETEILLSSQNIFMKIIGRGGGNFELEIPRDLLLEEGEEAVLPGLVPHTVALVVSTISDPRDSVSKALLQSPVNIQNIKFVEVSI